MHPELKKRFVKDLVHDLDGLAGRFEPFCYVLIELVAPADWSHRGTTKDGAPVGHTVDSKAHAGTWVAEYGTQKNYFDTKLTKLNADIEHAKERHPQVVRLWMISSQEASPAASTAVKQVEQREKQRGLDLVVLDARDIAEFIVDRLLNEPLIEKLRDYLPMLQRLHDEWAASHRVPSNPDYVERVNVEQEALQRLAANRSLLVTGIGGCGKSALCSNLAEKLRGQFELVLWVDAENIRRVEELSSVDVLRNGGDLNLRGLMRSRPCLVILDNLPVDLDLTTVLRDAHPATRIMATSQTGPASALRLVDMEREESRRVLDSEGTCPSDVFERVLAAVGGHPLMLSLLGALARDDGWGAVTALLSSATSLEDNQHGRVCARILGRHQQELDHAFRLVALVGNRVDEALWHEIAGEPARRSFQKRHFLAAASPSVVRVHDIVALSIAQLYQGEPHSRMFDELSRFIEKQMAETHSMTLQRVARSHYALFERLLNEGESRPAFRYAYALSRRPDMDLSLLGEPLALARALPSGAPQLSISVRAIIEGIECSFTVTSTRAGKHEGKKVLEELFPAFEQMLAARNLPPLLRRDLEHHRGKALDRLGKLPEAAKAFADLLQTHAEFHAARLQLARVLARMPDRSERAYEQLEAVFRFAEQRPSDLDLSIVLGAFETLTWRALAAHLLAAVRKHRMLLISTLRQGLQFGHEQPYKVLAQLGLKLSNKAPELLLELAELLPNALSTPETDQEWFAVAQIRKHKGKAMRQAHDAGASVALEEAAGLYHQIKQPSEFVLVQAAEAMLLVGRKEEALAFLERVNSSERGEFWHHRMAEVVADEPERALHHLNEALASPGSSYRPHYLQMRFRVRRALGEVQAEEDLEQAMAECQDPELKEQLQDELATYRR